MCIRDRAYTHIYIHTVGDRCSANTFNAESSMCLRAICAEKLTNHVKTPEEKIPSKLDDENTYNIGNTMVDVIAQ